MSPQPLENLDSRLPSLTGMRFVAAALVFVSHVAFVRVFADEKISGFLVDYLDLAGCVGVSFFFILSGFVLTWSARPGDTTRRFYRRRLVKIYPNHFVTWLAAVLLMLWAGRELTADVAVPSLLLVHSWSWDLPILIGTNAPSWTLACELFFYLCFPLLLIGLKKIPSRRLWTAALALVVAIALVPLVAQLLPESPRSPIPSVSWWKHWVVYFMPLPRILEFALGMIMARIVVTGRWIGLGRAPAALLVIAGYGLVLTLPDAYGLVAPIVLPLALLIAATAAADVAGRRSALAARPMVWLGEVSFAFYIVHFLTFEYGPVGLATRPFGQVGRSTPEAIGVIVVTFAMSLVLAWLLHRLVELPAMRRWRNPRRPVRKPAPAELAAATPSATTPDP